MSLYDYPIEGSDNSNPYDIEFVVFAGAGVNGVAYAGVIKSLENRDLRKHIKYWIGTSAGAIAAAFSALNADSNFILESLGQTDFNQLIDYKTKSWWSRVQGIYHLAEMVSRLGLNEGRSFNNWIRERISFLGYPPDITFSELYDLTGNHLTTVTTCLNSFECLYLNRASYPTMKIADAIHSSIIIPFIFQPIIIKDPHFELEQGRLVVDGGVLNNFPLNACDPQTSNGRLIGVNRKVVGFFMASGGLWGPSKSTVNNFLKFSQAIIDTMFRQQQKLQGVTPYFKLRSVMIDDFGNSPTDFNLSKDMSFRLFVSGYDAAENFLSKRLEMISDKGHLPINLFIPIIQQEKIEIDWIQLSDFPVWYCPLTNKDLYRTPIYQTNPDLGIHGNIVEE